MSRVRPLIQTFIMALALVPALSILALTGLILTGPSAAQSGSGALYPLLTAPERSPEAHRQAADLWLARGNLPAAAAHLEAALAASPDAATARALAALYLDLQSWNAARDTLRLTLTLAPAEGDWARWHLGLVLAPVEPLEAAALLEAVSDPLYDLTTARAVAGALRENDPLRAAGLLLETGQAAYAEHLLTQTALIGPTAESLALAALARHAQGKPADHWIAAALALAPDDPQIHYFAGEYWLTARDYAASIDGAVFYAAIANVLALTGDTVGAELWYEQAQQIAVNDPVQQTQVARLRPPQAVFDVPSSVNDLLQIEAQTPADRAALDGWSQFLGGSREAGLAAIDAALAQSQESALANYFKASVLLLDGDAQGARPYFERVAAGDSPLAGYARTTLDALTEPSAP
jgi:tetratricopeptide (TPR) repeat protein